MILRGIEKEKIDEERKREREREREEGGEREILEISLKKSKENEMRTNECVEHSRHSRLNFVRILLQSEIP